VQALNTELVSFPVNLVAGLFAFRQLPMFEAASGEREAVVVSLGDAP
jgi:hypothetical protein